MSKPLTTLYADSFFKYLQNDFGIRQHSESGITVFRINPFPTGFHTISAQRDPWIHPAAIR